MNEEAHEAVFDLLTRGQVAPLAVLVDGAPYTGLLPYVMGSDLQVVWIHASDLARHTKGLHTGAPFSLLIQAPPTDDQDPLQASRISLQGTVSRMEKGSRLYAKARQAYTAKYPQSGPIFEFQDFNLYELQISGGRFVAGFAQAFQLLPKFLASLSR